MGYSSAYWPLESSCAVLNGKLMYRTVQAFDTSGIQHSHLSWARLRHLCFVALLRATLLFHLEVRCPACSCSQTRSSIHSAIHHFERLPVDRFVPQTFFSIWQSSTSIGASRVA